MGRFRKKPVEVEAVQINATDFNGHDWDGNPFNEAAPQWLLNALKTGQVYPDTPNSTDYAEWRIHTLEGTMLAGPGDWIIRGTAGELYPCKPNIFANIYEPVEGEQ